MASTYSDLKIELIGTGEQAGTWGVTTNTNLGTALQEAITGSADVAFSSGDVTLTLTNSNSAQVGRNLRLNLTGTSGGARELILGSGMQVEKLYLINNGLADAVTVKNTAGTGIAVPAGKTMFVFNNGTNVVDAVTHLTSLTLGSALPVASGGTGATTSTGSGAVVLANTPTLITPLLGTPTSGALTNCTADGTVAVGFRNIPQSGSAKTTSYTLATGDIGKLIEVGSGGSIEVPNATFAAGDAVVIFNNTSGSITLTMSITTSFIGGTDADDNSISLATRGVCNVLFISGTVCVVTGNVT
jgi:hypothetical protein